MFPHERSLVKRMAEEKKPFALVGVNSDRVLKSAKEKNEKQEITWRSFWCGEQGTSGAIPKKWNVRGWPTLYLIDHKGIIRYKFLGNPGNEKLDSLIEGLVKEAEKDLKSSTN
ncbi:MAG: thioredoxin-like domain-containing protein [Gemmataceae bacterium]